MSTEQKKNFRYLHVMTDTNFAVTGTFVRMVNEKLAPKDHFFLIDHKNNDAPEYLKQYPNVLIVDDLGGSSKGNAILFGAMNGAEKIFFHSFGWHWKLQRRIKNRKDLCGKIVWIPWGRDLYEFERSSGNPLRKIYYAYTNGIMTGLRKKVSSAAVIFPKDRDAVLSKFGLNKQVFEGRYTTFSEEDVLRVKPETKDCTFRILLGHSAAKCLCHEEMLVSLAKYKDEDVKIYIPLSYGDLAYGKIIADRAKELFGDKAVILDSFMSADKYTALLWQMDAAIFHTDRQVALGNVCRLLYMGCRIYTKPEGALSQELSEKGCKFYDSGKIGKASLGELKADVPPNAPEWARDSMDIDKTAGMWQEIFAKA